MRYGIAVVHTRPFSGRFLDCVLSLEKPADGFYWIRVADLPVDEARNEAVRRFLAVDPPLDYLLQIDSDMTFAAASLERLASHGLDLVAGLCVARYRPFVPVVFRGVTRTREDGREFLEVQMRETFEWLLQNRQALTDGPAVLDPAPADALIPADGSGAAFLLAHRRVFEAIQAPWFRRDEPKRGEDFYFFQEARRAGFRLHIDRAVIVGHEGLIEAVPRDGLLNVLGECVLSSLMEQGAGLDSVIEFVGEYET